ncbi:hypothetical protein BaRGS_00014810, partial [Batillaria attramentaria]
MPRLDNAERHLAIGMLNAGMPVQRVAATLQVHNTTIFIVSRSVWLSLEPPPTGLDKEHL